ncbi:hypothetical protein [Sphingobacterium siyangense]|uniref:hypothetical protein n=1 Tax=Sphingobacterium siyangense TaxID=459529 RepID=UPI003C78A737
MKNILLIGFTLLFNNIYSQPRDTANFQVSGLVVSAQDHKPLKGVDIFIENKKIGITDDKGYFSDEVIASSNDKPVVIVFKKSGFKDFKQSERVHPSLLKKGFNFIIGLCGSSDTSPFSDTRMGALSYAKTKDRLPEVMKKDLFNKDLNALRMEKGKVLFEYKGQPYLLSESSWIKLESLDNIVVIDGREKGKARDINHMIQRDQIKGMTPDAEKKSVINITTFKNL